MNSHAIAKIYAQSFVGVSKKLIEWRPYICPFDEILRFIPDNSSIFDIGCGTGFLLYMAGVEKKSTLLEGVDTDERKLHFIESVLSSRLQKSKIVLHAATKIDNWPEKKFDVVLMIDVMHHIQSSYQNDFLKAAINRVAENGILIYKDISTRKLYSGMLNRLHDLILNRQWVHYWEKCCVVDFLVRNGFSVLKEEEVNMWWYCHDLLVMKNKDKQEV